MVNLFENKSLEKQVFAVTRSLLKLAGNAAVRAEVPNLNRHVINLRNALKDADFNALENPLLDLYIRLHRAGSVYSPCERDLLLKRKGYTCHPGGLSPLIKAVEFIRPDSIIADLGAGNGLQGLLLQDICPHRKTIQIEISSELIRIGRIFQRALGIKGDRVEWIHNDVMNVSIGEADFIYIYLPAKPLEGGVEVYKAIAGRLGEIKKPIVIFSVADCLSEFLDSRFSIFYTDGHLTCFSGK
jgi:hypothetical protein